MGIFYLSFVSKTILWEYGVFCIFSSIEARQKKKQKKRKENKHHCIR